MRIMGRMNTPKTQVLSLEERLKGSGIKVADVLSAARVDYSTWTRWKQGKLTPRMDSWMRVTAAAEERLQKQPERAA
jgi:hypothetical protein